jgi:hypothetical protein
MSRCRFPWLFLILSLALTPSFGAGQVSRRGEQDAASDRRSESRLKFAVGGAPTGGRSVRVDLGLLDLRAGLSKPLPRLNSDGRTQPARDPLGRFVKNSAEGAGRRSLVSPAYRLSRQCYGRFQKLLRVFSPYPKSARNPSIESWPPAVWR